MVRGATRTLASAAAAGCVLAAVPSTAAAADTRAPISGATLPACSNTGAINVGVGDEVGGSGPAGAKYRVDAGPVLFVAGTPANPSAIVLTVPEGVHRLEFWGVDRAGNEEAAHHAAFVRVDGTLPSLSITGRRFVRRGQHATVRIAASDASGLSRDPSDDAAALSTRRAGPGKLVVRAVDRCRNSREAVFAYVVARRPRITITRDFRVSATADVALTRVRARLDGRRVRVRRRGSSLRLALPPRLHRGRHRLTVSVVDRAGNRARRTRIATF